MGDIDSVTGFHLVQLENRQLKIEKLKKLKIGRFFLFVSIAGQYGKKNKILIFSEHLTNSWFCTILTSQFEHDSSNCFFINPLVKENYILSAAHMKLSSWC